MRCHYDLSKKTSPGIVPWYCITWFVFILFNLISFIKFTRTIHVRLVIFLGQNFKLDLF
jgi:hypothetical protein